MQSDREPGADVNQAIVFFYHGYNSNVEMNHILGEQNQSMGLH